MPVIFLGITRAIDTYSEILDITFRLLSTCSAARNRRMQLGPFFRAYHRRPLRISPRLSALSFSRIYVCTYMHTRAAIQLRARAKAGKKRVPTAATEHERRLMANTYREIARSSLDTTVAETGYANEQLTGPGERWLSAAVKITVLRKLKRT